MKLTAVTLGFCNWRTLAASWSRLYPAHLKGWRHWFVDCHYPLNREKNLGALREVALHYGAGWIDVDDDRGQAENFNRAWWLLGPCDYLAGIDPDAYIDGPSNTLQRCVDLLEANPRLAWVSLELPRTRESIRMHLRGGKALRCPATGLDYFMPRRGTVDAIDISVWRGSFLKEVGLKQERKWYGEAEISMARIAWAMGMNYAYLLDHRSIACREHVDPEYPAWKHAHLAGDLRGFAEWLGTTTRGEEQPQCDT